MSLPTVNEALAAAALRVAAELRLSERLRTTPSTPVAVRVDADSRRTSGRVGDRSGDR